MADEFAEFGGHEIPQGTKMAAPAAQADEFSEFGGKSSDDDADTMRAFANLARRIFFPQAALPDTARGLLSGLKRQDNAPDASIDEKAFNAIGRVAPAAGGALAAGAMLPAAAPLALAAGAVGLGAGAGEAYGQIASRALGGEAPETSGEAAKAIGETGLTAAATELGVGALLKGVAKAAPRFVSAFKTFPKEGMKRVLTRPDDVLDVIHGAKEPQVAAEQAGIKALREVQNGLTLARSQAGKKVEQALGKFQAVTKGQPIIDGFEVSASGAEALAARTTDDGISAITDAEVSKIGKLISDLDRQGPMSARDAVIWRQKLDALIDYRRGSVPEITSGQGQGIISQMAKALRDQIGKAAESAGFDELAKANAEFSQVARAYDAYRPAFSTKTGLGGEAVRRLEALERSFNKGGVPQADFTEIGKSVPILQGPVDKLLDAVVARRLTLESGGSPSGIPMTAIRFLAGPDGLATGLSALRGRTTSLRRGISVPAAGAMSGANQK